MSLPIITGIIVLSLLIAIIFFYGFKISGPWQSFWKFFIVTFLGIWLTALWIDPIGPVFWGVAWVDLVLAGIFFALLLAAASSFSTKDFDDPNLKTTTRKTNRQSVIVGAFFWIILLFFMLAVIARFLVS